MGNTVNSPAPAVRPPMRIHQIHGKNLTIASNRLAALRHEGYSDGLFFGSRPAAPGERLEIVINKIVSEWNGSLRFGFTTHNPVAINSHPEGIPRYMCPDLIKRGGSYVETLSQISLRARDRIVFWLETTGEACVKVNDVMQKCQIRGINKDVWPVVDVYGNTMDVAFRCLNDNMDLLETPQGPRYYSALNTSQFCVVSSATCTVNSTAEGVKRNATNKAYAWNQKPLTPNTIWMLFVNEVDHSVGANLSISILKNAPEPKRLPERLSDFSKLFGGGWMFNDVYARMNAGDELALCILQTGAVMVAYNGEKFEELGRVTPCQLYWIIADLNCSIISLTSVGIYRITSYPLPVLPIINASELQEESSCFETEIRQTNNVFESIHTPVMEEIQSLPVEIQRNNSEKPPSSECVICLDSAPNVVFIPCGHVCCCFDCAKDLFENYATPSCPACRKVITLNVKVHFRSK